MSFEHISKRKSLLFVTILLSIVACESEEELNPRQSITQLEKPELLYISGSQKCLAHDNVDGAKVIQNKCKVDANHQIKIYSAGDKVYNLKSADGKCLEVAGNSSDDNAKVEFAPCTGSKYQNVSFRQSHIDSLLHKIVFEQSKKCLSVLDQRRNDGAALVQVDCYARISQDFLIAAERTTKKDFPRNIWTYWDKGAAAMPAFYKANVAHWESVLKRNNLGEAWKIRVLNAIEGDEDYFGNFIDVNSIPTLAFIASKIGGGESKLTPSVVFSDFVRLELLYRYGGIWLDPSIILQQSFDNLENNLQVIDGLSMAGFTSRSQATYALRYADSFENFFIASFPQVELVKTWKSNFRKYWDLKQPGMDIEDNPLYNGSQGIKLDLSEFGSIGNYLNQHVALRYTLVTNPQYLNQILILGDTGVHEKGPFTLLGLYGHSDRQLMNLSKPEIEETLLILQDVLLSKFPSPNSGQLRILKESFFYDTSNIFGRLNSQ